MDASEHDLDAKLYKASGTLLLELQHKLPSLVYNVKKSPRKPRLFVIDHKCSELAILLDRFQEWPQLLDPHLAGFVQPLANAFLHYLVNESDHYCPSRKQGYSSISPLPRAICRLLYAFCKVRGYKVIVRLLNNEPKYLAPMLSTFKAWSTTSLGMTWEERYLMMLWLSHLMLAPFELANMSIASGFDDSKTPASLGDLPDSASNIVSVALTQLESPGKEREAASVLLVRLSLRIDMRSHNLVQRLVDHATQKLLYDDELVSISPYKALGCLSLLYGIANTSSDSEAAPYLEKLFQSMLKLITSQQKLHVAIRDSAPARKWILKILKAILTHVVSPHGSKGLVSDETVTSMLEESIQYFLDNLSDKDTPVRMAAAKALSLVTLKLDPAMATAVVEAILESLQENVLLEDPETHKLIPLTDRTKSEITSARRDVSAVDPLKWHGLMLTLGHLLFRRSPPPDNLSDIIQALILGLEFEQRSNVGTSVGVGVRDAACFGVWALARKYSTHELSLVAVSGFAEAALDEYADCQSVLQLLAIKLTIPACSDPSGNIRRGSSAALQELIGRHPDTILHGISVVQIVDYHAVARLSRAMTEVAPQAAALDRKYHRPLLRALLDWRGARAIDVSQRRWGATAVSTLTASLTLAELSRLVQMILRQLFDLKFTNMGSTAGARHGLLLNLTSVLQSLRRSDLAETGKWLLKEGRNLFKLEKLTGKLDGRVTADVELVMEAISSLIGQMCRCLAVIKADPQSLQEQDWTPLAQDVLNQCTAASGKDIVVQAGAEAYLELFKLLPNPARVDLIEKWLDSKSQSPAAFTSKGRIRTLSLVHAYLAQTKSHHDLQQAVLSYIIRIIEGNYSIETRVDGMDALGFTLLNHDVASETDAMAISEVLRRGLTDYTNDQRGDIGSTLRLSSIDAVDTFRSHKGAFSGEVLQNVMPLVVKLAAEKLNNVRFRAWKCLEGYWKATPDFPTLRSTFQHLADVSSISYFRQLLELLPNKAFREDLFLGLVSSATAGTEDICRAASSAFVAYMQHLDKVTGAGDLGNAISRTILDKLDASALQDDRHLVPLLEFLCFMLDQDLFYAELNDARDIWAIMQKVHGPSSSLSRVEASLNCYSRLLMIEKYRTRALDKLTRQLLHRWPKVRNTAADVLYLDSPIQTLASCDWDEPIVKTKPVVLELRRQLGVAGNATVK
ncbi:armadillo-type protein [Exophiala viscosa]|uniref:armadillo-type protein n=1 Tax=Exophiala viscosa TaxID=2486360 RepID=UPI0021997228|nr:armadillo-type protein [Exophiala viscosa]